MTAAPSSPNTELELFDEEAFDLVDNVTKVVGDLVEKVKCSLHVIGEIVGESELKSVYEEFQTAVKNVLHDDMPQCVEKDGLLEKLM